NDNASNKPRWVVGDETNTPISVLGNAALSNNVWYHIAGTYDGVTAKLYINGSLVNSTAGTLGGTQINTFPLTIGATGNTGATEGPLRGNIDEVAIFETALSDVDILNYFNSSGRCPKLYFKGKIQGLKRDNNVIEMDGIDSFDELTGTELYDLIIEGQTLTATQGGTADKVSYGYYLSTLDNLNSGVVSADILDVDGAQLTSSIATIENIFVG